MATALRRIADAVVGENTDIGDFEVMKAGQLPVSLAQPDFCSGDLMYGGSAGSVCSWIVVTFVCAHK